MLREEADRLLFRLGFVVSGREVIYNEAVRMHKFAGKRCLPIHLV
jgi:hypothetical protein